MLRRSGENAREILFPYLGGFFSISEYGFNRFKIIYNRELKATPRERRRPYVLGLFSYI